MFNQVTSKNKEKKILSVVLQRNEKRQSFWVAPKLTPCRYRVPKSSKTKKKRLLSFFVYWFDILGIFSLPYRARTYRSATIWQPKINFICFLSKKMFCDLYRFIMLFLIEFPLFPNHAAKLTQISLSELNKKILKHPYFFT